MSELRSIHHMDLQRQWRKGQTWEVLTSFRDYWTRLPEGYEPAWFSDSEYRLFRDPSDWVDPREKTT